MADEKREPPVPPRTPGMNTVTGAVMHGRRPYDGLIRFAMQAGIGSLLAWRLIIILGDTLRQDRESLLAQQNEWRMTVERQTVALTDLAVAIKIHQDSDNLVNQVILNEFCKPLPDGFKKDGKK